MTSFEQPRTLSLPENQSDKLSDLIVKDSLQEKPSTLALRLRDRLSTIKDKRKLESLMLKEEGGDLTQAEFHQLLSLEFKQLLRDVPPIESEFMPEEELTRIMKLGSAERRREYRVVKDKLVRQRRALAACQLFITKVIYFNHDIPKEELIEIFKVFAAKYSFSNIQVQIFYHLVEAYYIYRQRALKMRKIFPDNAALVSALTGLHFTDNSQFEILIGPMSIEVLTDNDHINQMYYREKYFFEPGKILEGFASQSLNSKPVFFNVINVESTLLDSHETIRHEQTHQINKVFGLIFNYILPPENLLYVYDQIEDDKRKIEILNTCFLDERAVAFDQVKDEIFAILSQKNFSIERWPTMKAYLLKLFSPASNESKNNFNRYDYLIDLRNDEKYRGDAVYQQLVQKILIDGYQENLEEALEAFQHLLKQGESIQSAMALLTEHPLENWPKAVRGLLS